MMEIFNRKLLNIKQNNLAFNYANYNFVKKEVVSNVLDRLYDVKIDFKNALDIGCSIGEVADYLKNTSKIQSLTQIDECQAMLDQNIYPNKILSDLQNISLPENSFDLIISIFALHNINDLSKMFTKIYNLLTYGGLFVCSLPIVGTLAELEQALMQSEIELYSGFSPRIHPFSDLTTLGNLLQSTKFKNIIADKDSLSIMYKNPYNIFKDLKHSLQGNILNNKNNNIVSKAFFPKVISNLSSFIDEESQHYKISIVYCNLIAWKE